ncbi:hypothetical protein EDB89DRAFT_1907301 [Lactarius sanguifluus]|nr:hypothetical protein EDB89DRAFT_1907301 [Lactarius sanguifluus]
MAEAVGLMRQWRCWRGWWSVAVVVVVVEVAAAGCAVVVAVEVATALRHNAGGDAVTWLACLETGGPAWVSDEEKKRTSPSGGRVAYKNVKIFMELDQLRRSWVLCQL